MGSGFSGCTGPASVGIAEELAKQGRLRRSHGEHSDSCDSGIFLNEGRSGSSRVRQRPVQALCRRPDSDEEEEEDDLEEDEAVPGSDVGCGTDNFMISTPRAGARSACGKKSGRTTATVARPLAANPYNRSPPMAVGVGKGSITNNNNNKINSNNIKNNNNTNNNNNNNTKIINCNGSQSNSSGSLNKTPIASSTTPIASSTTPIASSMTPIASSTTPIASSTTPIASSTTPIASSKTPIASSTTPRSNPEQVSLLRPDAIHEEDEQFLGDGEPEDKRLRAQRPPRPKSAHFRKSRAQVSQKGRATRHRDQPLGPVCKASYVDLSSDDSEPDEMDDEIEEEDEAGGVGERDFDVLSIPDETSRPAGPAGRPNALTTVRLGSQQGGQDWWTEEDVVSPRGRDGFRRTGSDATYCSLGGSFRAKGREDNNSRVRKKASERSISSILLSPALEADTPRFLPPPSSPLPPSASCIAGSVTNSLCFAVTNPEITQHIVKSLREIVDELKGVVLSLCAKEDVTSKDYTKAMTSLRPRFLRLLGDFKMATGDFLGILPTDCQEVTRLEEELGERVRALVQHCPGGRLELGPLVSQHLQELEEVCERLALPGSAARPHRLIVATRGPHHAVWDESGVEDDSDTTTDEGVAGSVVRNRAMNGSRAASCIHPNHASPLSGSTAGHQPEDSDDTCSTITSSPTPALPKTTTTTATPLAGGDPKRRPDSGVVLSSCSASCSSSEATRDDTELAVQTEWIAASLEMLDQILQVQTESHETLKSLVEAITKGSTSDQLKAHALYRWLASQSVAYYVKCTKAKLNSPTGKLRQVAEGKVCYASLYQDMARAAGLKCERIEGYAKSPDYRPGCSVLGHSSSSSTKDSSDPQQFKHSWNVVWLNGHYHFLDAGFGALPCKFFVEHYFMTPPDEMRLSHFPRDPRWLLMTQPLSLHDFEGTLKTWPAMFAFNIRPLNMQSVLRSYDGRLSITVLLRNVVVTPQLEYVGPGPPQDADALAFNIDQEIRNHDNAETFHLNLHEEGLYYFTLMVHDLEEGEDIPAFQYRVDYRDELL